MIRFIQRINISKILTAIEIKNVTKRFKDRLVIDETSLELMSAQIHGLIGRSGSGTIRVFGDVIGSDEDFAKNVGTIIETPGFLPFESGFSSLKYLASIRGKISDKEIKM